MADFRAIYTGSFPTGEGFNRHPEMSLSGPDRQIPDYAIIRQVTLRTRVGVGKYGQDLDANFRVSDGADSFGIENTINESSSPVWIEVGDPPPKALNWNSLQTVSMYGSNNLFTRGGQSELWIDYDEPTTPSAPDGVAVNPSSVAAGNATLSWSASTPGENNPVVRYEVWTWDHDNGGPISLYGTTTGLSYTVKSAEGNGATVAYAVRALGSVSGFDSPFSLDAVLRTEWSAPGTPGAPSLSANNVPPESAVVLTWAASAPGTNNPPRAYEVYRSIDGAPFVFLMQTTGPRATVYAPDRNGLPFVYKAKALGTVSSSDSGFSGVSAQLFASFTAPGAPSGLTVNGETSVFVDAGDELAFKWQPSTPGTNNPVLSYDLYKDGQKTESTTQTELKIKAPYTYGKTFKMLIRAHGQYSDSQPSNEVSVTINIPPAPPRSLEAISEFLFFDKDDVLQFVRADAVSVTVTEEEFRCNAVFPYNANKEITHGMRIGWLERDELLLFEVRQPTTDAVAMTQTIEAEHVAIAELLDAAIEDRRPTNVTAARAVEIALEGTDWNVGENTFGGENMTTEYYMESVWSALLQTRDKWGCTISPRLMYTEAGVIRFIDVLSRRGENRGVRLSLDLNAQAAGVTYDDRGLYTALYGQGSSPGEGQRLITFENAFWSIENGDPANKPRGQKYVEDVTATEFFGRKGRKRAGFVQFDTLDADELLRKTWAALQVAKLPRVTIDMTAFNLAAIGYAWQGLAWGDDVVVVLDEINVEIAARVTQFERDVLRPENSKPVIGDYRPDLVFEFAKG